MKKIFLYLCFIIPFFVACDKESEEYPIKIETMEFSLSGTDAYWVNLEQNTVYLINSQQEYEKYILGNKIPEINFDNYSLIVAYGKTNNGISSIKEELIQIAKKEYNLNVTIKLNDTYVNGEWIVSILAPKLVEDSKIELKVEQSKINEDYPIEIPFTEYSLEGTSCQWKNFDPNTVIIINSNEELKNYIICTDDNYSEIDFSNQSLLLVRDWATSGILNIDIDFFKNTISEYALNVIIHTDMTAFAPPWLISIITPKIDNEVIVLNVQQVK